MKPVTFKWLNIFIAVLLINVTKQDDAACEGAPRDGKEELQNHIRCKGRFQKAESLRDAIANITDPIDVFELYNSSLDLLPEDIFRDVKNAFVRKVILTESSLNLFSLPESKIHPFHSIENTLESFEVYDSSFAFAWNFSVSLNALKSVVIENSDVLTVDDTFKSFPNIRFIQLINCKIRWIHKKAFKKNKNLSILSLSNNLIETVERSMFPRPALSLWSLDLSYNKIATLPKDVFEDMIHLKELKLDFNRLKAEGGVYKRVWNHLTQLWLDGNDLICWSFCPVVFKNKREKNDRPQFFNSSKCELPGKGKVVLLDSFNC